MPVCRQRACEKSADSSNLASERRLVDDRATSQTEVRLAPRGQISRSYLLLVHPEPVADQLDIKDQGGVLIEAVLWCANDQTA